MTATDIWNGDLLGRRDDADFLLRFLVNRVGEYQRIGRKESLVLNVDAEWGQGKSFFIQGLKKEIAKAGHPVVLINAWQDDFANDPFTAVMAEIHAYVEPLLDNSKTTSQAVRKAYAAVQKNFKKIVIASAKGMVGKLGQKMFGDATSEIAGLIAEEGATGEYAKAGAEGVAEQMEDVATAFLDRYAENLINDFNEGKSSLQTFRDSLSTFLTALDSADLSGGEREESRMKVPFFVLIDELDRCRPTYAISMLERIKHLFDVPNLVFVIATDTRQLSESIRSVYGAGFNGSGYLQRFFSQTYELPRAERRAVVDEFFASSGINMRRLSAPGGDEQHIKVFIGAADEFFNLNLRELKQCLDILQTVTTAWPFPFPIVLPAMFPLIVGFIKKWPLDNFAEQGHWFGSRTGENNKRLKWEMQMPPRSVDLISICHQIKSAIAVPATDYLEKGRPNSRTDLEGSYVYEAIAEEVRALQPVSWTGQVAARSNVLRYPDLVRRAGQFK